MIVDDIRFSEGLTGAGGVGRVDRRARLQAPAAGRSAAADRRSERPFFDINMEFVVIFFRMLFFDEETGEVMSSWDPMVKWQLQAIAWFLLNGDHCICICYWYCCFDW